MANKKKSSLMQTLVIVGAALLCFGGYYLYAGKYADSIQFKNPAGKATQYYEKHKYVYDIWSLPTKMDYYLLPPAEIYDDVKYPLMVILHGGTGKAYAAGFMAEDYYREKYPGYVLVPVVPPNHVWWSPYQTPPKGFENALPYRPQGQQRTAHRQGAHLCRRLLDGWRGSHRGKSVLSGCLRWCGCDGKLHRPAPDTRRADHAACRLPRTE
jgi:hypothetical protein